MSKRPKSRIALHRERELKPDEAKLLSNVEEYDCHIIHVAEDNLLPAWSYTIGLYEKFQQLEIIIVGLKSAVAQSVLNGIAARMKEGLRAEEGLRLSGLLSMLSVN